MTEASIRPNRGQVSLLTLVLASVIVALALGLWRSGSEIATLRSELKRVVSATEQELERWRAEVGALKIDDPTKLHAIQIETFEDLTWKWRVFVPNGRQFVVGSQFNRIPKDGTPDAAGPVLGPGEQVVSLAIRKSAHTDQWEYIVAGGQGSVRFAIEPEDSIWIGKPAVVSQTIGRVPHVAPVDEPLVLLRYRSFGSASDRVPPDPEPPLTEGMLVWLQPGK